MALTKLSGWHRVESPDWFGESENKGVEVLERLSLWI